MDEDMSSWSARICDEMPPGRKPPVLDPPVVAAARVDTTLSTKLMAHTRSSVTWLLEM